MSDFTARAERGDDWWCVTVDEEPGIITQTRRLDQIPDTVSDALALFPELTDDPAGASIDVVIADDDSELDRVGPSY